jgi:hypothetical protein
MKQAVISSRKTRKEADGLKPPAIRKLVTRWGMLYEMQRQQHRWKRNKSSRKNRRKSTDDQL